MAEEISAAVSRFRSPRLMATASFGDGGGPAVDVMGRCRMYELDYIMDGTIEVNGTRVRMNVVLLDVVLDFEVVWTGCFDGNTGDLFALQDKIAAETVKQLDPDLYSKGPAFDTPVRTSISTAHHLVLEAIQGIFQLDKGRFLRSRTLLTEALRLDPDYAAAHAWLAYWSIMAVGQGWVLEPKDLTALAGVSASRAVELDSLDARAWAIAGHVKGYLLHNVPDALEYHARAIELNPNLSIAWALSSVSKVYNGEHTTAVRHAAISRSLSPRDPHIFLTENALMLAHFFRGDLESANTLADVVLMRSPGHASGLNIQLSILGHLGRVEEAAKCLQTLRAIDPNVSISKIISRIPLRPKDNDYYALGLRRGGLPE